MESPSFAEETFGNLAAAVSVQPLVSPKPHLI